MSKLDFFRRGRLQRNLSRTHRPCRTCDTERTVCEHCIKVICEVCGHECVSAVRRTTTPTAVQATTTAAHRRSGNRSASKSAGRPVHHDWADAANAVRAILERLDAVGCDTHPDNPDVFRAIFLKAGKSVADYDKRLWNDDDFKRLATDSNLGVGAVADVQYCYLPFRLL